MTRRPCAAGRFGQCIAIASLLLASGTARVGEPWVRLHGTTTDTEVRLVWDLREWPKELVGFSVRRRPAGSTGAWEAVTPTPVIPEISATKDLSNVEPDRAAREKLKTTTEK